MPAAEDRADCLAAERPDPCWKIHQKLVASIVPFDIGGPLYRVQRLRLTDLTDTARHPKPLAIAPRIIANADYCFPSAKWTWIEFHRGLPRDGTADSALTIVALLRRICVAVFLNLGIFRRLIAGGKAAIWLASIIGLAQLMIDIAANI
jgi:hypothetical protein